MQTVSQSLSMLLGPLELSEFLQSYWERAPIHISRQDEQHFASLLSTMHIESLLSTQTQYFPSVQLTHRSKPVVASEYTDDNRRILTSQFIKRHHEGATIVWSQAHEKFSALAEFRREVQTNFHLRCQTNVYLSPPDQKGFGPHYDSHDVFILQVEGSKTFNLYEGGVVLPFSHEPFQADIHECGELTESILLEAGDTLYIPRGVMHDAVACESASLHITLGVYAMTLQDVMLDMIHRLGEESVIYRRSVPPTLWHAHGPGSSADMSQPEAAVTNACLHPAFSLESFQQSVSTLLDDVAIETSQDLSGRLAHDPQRDVVVTDGEIRLRVEKLMSTERLPDAIRVRTQGQVLEFNGVFSQVMEQLMEGNWLSAADLGFNDEAQKKNFCHQLITANLLDLR